MTNRWIPALMMVAMGLPGWAQTASQVQSRFPLTPHQVAQALSGNGIQVADDQVSLLATVVASESSPLMEVLSVKPLGDRSSGKRRESHSLVKLGCRVAGACLPFYTIVSKPAAAFDNMPIAQGVSIDGDSTALKPKAPIVMRQGTHATLVMNDSRMQVQVSVISLENGIAGHKIRVESPDHKQIYVAEVVSETLLKRSF
jgi:hypothetical protein